MKTQITLFALITLLSFSAAADNGAVANATEKNQDVEAILAELNIATTSDADQYGTVSISQTEAVHFNLAEIESANYRLHIYDLAGEDVTIIYNINAEEVAVEGLGQGFYYYKLVGNGTTYAGNFSVK